MRIGVHVSIQGNMATMAGKAVNLGCETVQIFSRSPRGGKARELPAEDVAGMKDILDRGGIEPLVIHAPYFLNLASSEDDKRKYSVDVLVEDLMRADTLGARFVVTHVGHRDPGEDGHAPQALARSAQSIHEALTRYSGPVKLLLENTAGQGREVGSSFEAIASLLRVLPERRVAACLDTCHAFAAGYDLSSHKGVAYVLSQFDSCIGLGNLELIHLNDSKGDLGSHIDRHHHIGQGHIGIGGFAALINNDSLPPELPGILETPTDSPSADRDNVGLLKSLRRS